MNIERNNFPVSTPIQIITSLTQNKLYIKRDDLYPLSFGGNKARKGRLFFEAIKNCCADYVVTYGSSSSNHCRVIANLAAMHDIPCIIISPDNDIHNTFNRKMVSIMGATYIYTSVEKVADTIENVLCELKSKGYSPFFIPGGGHGNIGTQAYVETYQEIMQYQESNNVFFDYIFLASGTGTTQAGLICGQIINYVTDQIIVGISIARKNPRGKQVVVDSVNSYFDKRIVSDNDVNFVDDYVCEGYGKACTDIVKIIKNEFIINGIPLDTTYTGKAFWGMTQYLLDKRIAGKNILFIHTGGTPLFFDDLEEIL